MTSLHRPLTNPVCIAAFEDGALRQQSAARAEEVIEALLEGRPIRSWSAPELVELEALAAGEQVGASREGLAGRP